MMIKIELVEEIGDYISQIKATGKTVGLVPTMGALHEGHVSLVEKAKSLCDVVVVSIFVNPTQFNNATDLEKYPRTLENDMSLLAPYGVDVVFAPTTSEIYPANYQAATIELGKLDRVMEGEHRPGHFQGVVEVVKRLFEITQPDFAFFGQKDFQQVAVIKFMVEYFQMPVTIVECPIIRSEKGLALSSRNMRLSAEEKEQALVIYQTMVQIQLNYEGFTPNEWMKKGVELINAAGLEAEYLEIVHPTTLEKLTDTWIDEAVCCVAAYCGSVRLIDNMTIRFPKN